MLTVGVAGHIDHGKSSLVRFLTGSDPDRLPEEKKRGMTIDLGFARWHKPGGSSDDVISFVDVPGHERFVRNMIAGATGIEAIILVIAADDGWMPQSQEHFDIVKLLGIEWGIVVITKSDLVEPEWLKAVTDEIRERIKDSFLKSAPIVPLSSTTGKGKEELLQALESLLTQKFGDKDIGKPRLYIDRAFDMPGMGKVVTGSMRDGGFAVGEEVALYPSGASGKIRSLQRHSTEVDSVDVGQRTAIAFTGVDRESLTRGTAVTRPDISNYSVEPRYLIARIKVLPDCPVELKSRRKMLLFVGTAESRCELLLPSGETIFSGDQKERIVVIRMHDKTLLYRGDRFVLRLPTPQVTIGGGMVLGWSEKRPSKKLIEHFTEQFQSSLSSPKNEILSELLLVQLTLNWPLRKDSLMFHSVFAESSVDTRIAALVQSGQLIESNGLVAIKEQFDEVASRIVNEVTNQLQKHPHLKGLTTEQITRTLPSEIRIRISSISDLLKLLTDRSVLISDGHYFKTPGATRTVTGAEKQEADRILRELMANPFSPPLVAQLTQPGKTARSALGYLYDTGDVIKVSTDVALLRDSWFTIMSYVNDTLNKSGELTVGELRDKFATSRKYVVPILEELDRREITQRSGDVRIKGPKFGAVG